MRDARHRLPAMIRAKLDGLDWRLSNGGKHLVIGDRMIAAIPCSASENSKTWLRVRGAIRKHRKECA
jgi:hypothetical protein